MTSDAEDLAKIILEYMPGADGPSDSSVIAEAIIAAGFVRVGWEYGVSIDGREAELVWDKYPGDERRAKIEEDSGLRLMRRSKAGPWERFEESDQ